MQFFQKVKTYVVNVLYNTDRMIDTAAGFPPQETISSEIGRHESNPIDKAAADVLDDIQKDHVENAVIHANKLDAADNGMEQ